MSQNKHGFIHNIDMSAILTVVGIILLFSTAVIITLVLPRHIDPTWTTPTNSYQVQMYTVSDPNLYISSASGKDRQLVYHLQADFTLLSFHENDFFRIVTTDELEKYITRVDDKTIKLTSRLLMLRTPESSDMIAKADKTRSELDEKWEKEHSNNDQSKEFKPDYSILELYAPEGKEAFAVAATDGILENWVDANFVILDDSPKQEYHKDSGVIYISNPQEYRILRYTQNQKENWKYDPNGKIIANLDELKSHSLGFLSRQQLIRMGEHIYAIEGCWYCHSDQTRTMVQDVVLNGSDSYPAPPSSPNEYIYDNITFLSTRRIGPDLSRVAIKRPSRDWHRSHFWSPKTESVGSIMPSFRHFFDDDPRGTEKSMSLPNVRFEAIFQYLMTKGTRISPPTQAWWLGKDPIQTIDIIEGRKKL